MPDDTKPCPDCNALMIHVFAGSVRGSNPPMNRMRWWCGCGRREDADLQPQVTFDDLNRSSWHTAQQIAALRSRL